MPEQHISSENPISRRSFLQQSLTLPLAVLLASCAGSVSTTGSASQATASPRTSPGAHSTTLTSPPTCNGALTPSQTEGPYYKAGSPERTSLREPGIVGTPLKIRDMCFLPHASRLLMPGWTSGKQIAKGITTTLVSSCAAISSQTNRADINWKPLSQDSIRVEHAIFM
jgi:hypothetical protein